ncbi:MAG: hypothetical protein U0N99_05170, partial [Collinsella sp.]
QASNSSGLGRIAPCRIQIRQGATIVQSQEDDGAECQSWSNRALNNHSVHNDYLIPAPFSSFATDFFARWELLRNTFGFFRLSLASGITHLSTERGNHAKNKKNEMGGGF